MDEAVTPGTAPDVREDLPAAEVAPLVWVAHPLRRRPVFGSLIGLGIAALAVAVGFWTGSTLWGLFSAGVLFLSLEAFFLPSRYEAGPVELVVQKAFSNVRTPWVSFRRVYEDRHGLTLSPFRRRSLLEPYRSARLLYDGGDAGLIRAFVRARCPEAEWLAPEPRRGKETPQ